MYVAIILAYILIFVKMGKLFKSAFPDDFKEMSIKFGVIFFVYESFLISRAICYYMMLMTRHEFHNKNSEDYTWEYIVFYTTEIILIAFLSYVSLKSANDDGEREKTILPSGNRSHLTSHLTSLKQESMRDDKSSVYMTTMDKKKFTIIDLRNSMIHMQEKTSRYDQTILSQSQISTQNKS